MESKTNIHLKCIHLRRLRQTNRVHLRGLILNQDPKPEAFGKKQWAATTRWTVGAALAGTSTAAMVMTSSCRAPAHAWEALVQTCFSLPAAVP